MTNVLTDFADQAVLLPISVAVAVLLAASERWRAMAGWIMAVASSLGLILLAKLALAGCSLPAGYESLRNPSGHTVAATVVYGGIMVLLGCSGTVCVAIAAVAAIVIGETRLALGYHTMPEVLAGAAVGLMGVLALLHDRPRWSNARAGWPLVAVRGRAMLGLIVLGMLLLLHGQRLRAEPLIRHVAEVYVRAAIGCTAR